MRAVFMSVVMFFSLILFAIVANGCGPGVAETIVSAMPHDRMPVAGADASFVSDAAVSVEDAIPDVVHAASRAIAMGSETCDDDTILVPSDFARPGETVWHLCYATPTTETSSTRMARQVSEYVTFTQRSSWPGDAVPLIQIRPVIADIGWTASVLVALPDAPAAHPLWNARNIYDWHRGEDKVPEPLWAVGADETGRGFETHGVFRAWRISPDGRRESISLRVNVNGDQFDFGS